MKLSQLFENISTKLVDTNGDPLVVYHGTNTNFDKFDYKLAGAGNDTGMRGRGFYFTPHRPTAEGYGKNVIEANLIIKNPFIPTDYKTTDELINALGLTKEVEDWGLDSYIPGVFKFNPDDGTLTVMSRFAGRFTGIVKDAGFDGIIYKPAKEVIVFSDDQIKIIK